MTKIRPLAVSLLLVPVACGSAEAVQPDPANPAHCVAAFSYARALVMRERVPDVKMSVDTTARALFEGRRIKESGRSDTFREEGETFISRYGKDDKAMMDLILQCGTRQDADPTYRALDDSGALMAAARKVDPVCQKDARCAAYR